MKNNKIQTENKAIKSQIMFEGSMNFGQLDNGLHVADFINYEEAHLEPYVAKCKVQRMRDGNTYITELPRRKRNKPLFREDNSSLSKGADGRWYFSFSLSDDQLEMLPERLVHQASAIAKKVLLRLMVNG